MKGSHQLHRHPELPLGWLMATCPVHLGRVPRVVEYQATILDGNYPFCMAIGDTPATAERNAVELFKLTAFKEANGGNN